MKNRLLHILFLTLIMFGSSIRAATVTEDPKVQESQGLRSVAPNVYLDCSRRTCDLNYIRKEITFVNYVRDRQSADVHILVTQQRTGSGGNEYTLAFIGLQKYQGRDSTLQYISKSTDTSDQVRSGMVNVLKQGLIPYVSDTPLAEYISISYKQRKGFKPAPVKDKWNFWVFSVSFRGNLDLEQQSKSSRYNISLSANRTTEEWKMRFWANGEFRTNKYQISDTEELVSKTKRKTFFTQAIKSLGDHWAVGASVYANQSTYDNADLFASIGPAIEYNIYPYDVSTRRELRIQYSISYGYRDYIETTLYEKDEEYLFSHRLQVNFSVREPWGNIGVQLSGSNFLHDFSKNNLKAEGGFNVRILKGLSFNMSAEYTRIRDQLSLPKGGATYEDILLKLKRLASNYRFELQVGFSYRFGSIYNNVVNPRFGNR